MRARWMIVCCAFLAPACGGGTLEDPEVWDPDAEVVEEGDLVPEAAPLADDWEEAGTLASEELGTSSSELAATTCIRVPGPGACWHASGGRYASGACSGAYQCCDGRFASKGTCGACTCTETTGSVGCVPETEGRKVCFPAFEGSKETLPAALRERMRGSSWHAGCPVGLSDLRLLKMSYWGFDGEIHQGRMVVAASVADNVLRVFRRLYVTRFPIKQMRLVDDFGGSDDQSMAANNTSAFNCRPMVGGTAWSRHSYGTAIDINPIQNPYVSGSTVLPPAGEDYVRRVRGVKGMIVAPGPVTGAFSYRGWDWGGAWRSFKDYQHFEKR